MIRIIAILGASTLALGVTSSYLWMQLRGEREQRGALQARVQELERGTGIVSETFNFPDPVGTTPGSAAQESEARMPREAGATNRAPSTSRAANGAPHAPGAGVDKDVSGRRAMLARLRDMRERRRKLLSNPEFRAAMQAQLRTSVQQEHPDLASELRLQPEQLDKLFDLLAEHQLRAMTEPRPYDDPANTGTPDSQQQKMAEWGSRAEEAQKGREAEIAALLGTQYPDWQQYQSSLGARMQVRELRNNLDSSPEPLRAEQIRPLVAAIAEAERLAASDVRNDVERQRSAGMPGVEEHLAMPDRQVEWLESYQQRIHAAVSPYLTATQVARFEETQKQQLDAQRAQATMLREQQAAAARGEIATVDESMIYGTDSVVVSGQQ